MVSTTNALKKEMFSRVPTKEFSAVIIDGSAISYTVKWPTKGTVADYVTNYWKYIARKLALHDVHLVFDRYYDYNTRGVTRAVRGAAVHFRIHQLSLAMQLPPQKDIMTMPGNMKQRIQLIIDALEAHFLAKPEVRRNLAITRHEKTSIEINHNVKIKYAVRICERSMGKLTTSWHSKWRMA